MKTKNKIKSIPALIASLVLLGALPAGAETTRLFTGPDNAELLDHLSPPGFATGDVIHVRGTGASAKVAASTRNFSAARLYVGTSFGAGVLWLNSGGISLTDGASQTLVIGQTVHSGTLYMKGGSLAVRGGVTIGSVTRDTPGNGALLITGGSLVLSDSGAAGKAVINIASGGHANASGLLEISNASVTGGFIAGHSADTAPAGAARLTVHGDAGVRGVAQNAFVLRKSAAVTFVLTPGGGFKTFDQSLSSPAQINDRCSIKLDVSRLDPAAVAARPSGAVDLVKLNPQTDDLMWRRLRQILVLSGYDQGTPSPGGPDSDTYSFSVNGSSYTLVLGWDNAARTLKLSSLAKAP
ncbi:MAG: hypothetical protein LBC18_08810 [Opitutaceae bacterium]|jgi:hypothetical protein|nr:hypothetical protein [Opitutaceae bacterium]